LPPNTPDGQSHFRYKITAVLQPLQKSWQDTFIKMAPQGLGTGTAAQTSSSGGASAGSTVGGAAAVTWEVTFGLSDDTGGVNAAQKYAPVTASGTPIRGLLTIVTPPTSGVLELDVLASTDKGNTWNSIMASQIQIPAAATTPAQLIFAIENFTNANLPAGSMLRLDVLAGNVGAKNIVLWLAGGPAGTSGYTASGAIDGSGITFTGSGVI
jgi:hypothetical protein